jgi:hypothetical protein
MSIWHCDTHGLTGSMACCSQARRATIEKADAYSGMVQDLGESQGQRPTPGNWIKYEDYLLLWNEYRFLVDRGLAALARRSTTTTTSEGTAE